MKKCFKTLYHYYYPSWWFLLLFPGFLVWRSFWDVVLEIKWNESPDLLTGFSIGFEKYPSAPYLLLPKTSLTKGTSCLSFTSCFIIFKIKKFTPALWSSFTLGYNLDGFKLEIFNLSLTWSSLSYLLCIGYLYFFAFFHVLSR